jgi:hypothetical protein
MSPFTRQTNGRVYKKPASYFTLDPIALNARMAFVLNLLDGAFSYAAKVGQDAETVIKEYISKIHKEKEEIPQYKKKGKKAANIGPEVE